MKLDLTTNRGKANVKWSYDEAHPYLAEGQIKSFLLAAFFARTLVNNPQNSMELIQRIDSSSKF